MKKAEELKVAGIGDAAVKAKTRKGWREWFEILDAAGARKMNHTEIAAHLYKELRVPGWWCQMVAVGYEQARGLRQKHQTPQGFQVSSSKTIAAPLGVVYRAWENPRTRRAWLWNPDFTLRKATPRKSLRLTWVDGKSHVDVYFTSKGAKKSSVSVDHTRLSDAGKVERMRAYWSKALERLKALAET